MISMGNCVACLKVRQSTPLTSILWNYSFLVENQHLKEPEDVEKFFKLAEYIRNGQTSYHRGICLLKGPNYRDFGFVLAQQVPAPETVGLLMMPHT
jgi:hypothetical protein